MWSAFASGAEGQQLNKEESQQLNKGKTRCRQVCGGLCLGGVEEECRLIGGKLLGLGG